MQEKNELKNELRNGCKRSKKIQKIKIPVFFARQNKSNQNFLLMKDSGLGISLIGTKMMAKAVYIEYHHGK